MDGSELIKDGLYSMNDTILSSYANLNNSVKRFHIRWLKFSLYDIDYIIKTILYSNISKISKNAFSNELFVLKTSKVNKPISTITNNRFHHHVTRGVYDSSNFIIWLSSKFDLINYLLIDVLVPSMILSGVSQSNCRRRFLRKMIM